MTLSHLRNRVITNHSIGCRQNAKIKKTEAIARGDEIIMATEPVEEALYKADGSLTGFGKEYDYLMRVHGYHYDSILKKMIKN